MLVRPIPYTSKMIKVMPPVSPWSSVAEIPATSYPVKSMGAVYLNFRLRPPNISIFPPLLGSFTRLNQNGSPSSVAVNTPVTVSPSSTSICWKSTLGARLLFSSQIKVFSPWSSLLINNFSVHSPIASSPSTQIPDIFHCDPEYHSAPTYHQPD